MILEGKNMMLYLETPGKMAPFACATKVVIDWSVDIREATKKSNSRFKSYYAAALRQTLEVEGINKLDDINPDFEFLVKNIKEGSVIKWIAQDKTNEEVIYAGTALAGSLALISTAEGFGIVNAVLTGTDRIFVSTPYEVYVYGDVNNNIYSEGQVLYGYRTDNGFPGL